MRYACCFFISIAVISLFLSGCISTENAFGTGADIEKQGFIIPSRFFVLKKGDGDYINNITFKEHSALLTARLESGAWTSASYGEAATFLLLEYGEDSFYDRNTVIKPKYDRDTNTTAWVHTGAEIKKKPYVRITGINGTDYRVNRKETVLFTLIVTHGESVAVDQELISEMVIVGAESLM